VDLSVLIVSYNTASYLKDCLNSIFRSRSQFTFEVIVVDNNSVDGTSDLKIMYRQVRWIFNQYNYGFATAMNQAYRVSRGRYVMSFNPDAEVFEDTLHQALSYMEANPKIGKVGLATMNRGNVILPHSEFRKIETPHLIRMFRQQKSKQANLPFSVDWIFGTGMIIRKSALPDDRLYDETSFLFWEEYGLSKYIRERGYELYILPHVRILHHISVTMKVPDENRIFWARLLSLSHQWRIRKQHYGRINALVNVLIGTADNMLLYIGLSLKSWLSAPDPVRMLERLDRKVQTKAHLRLLMSDEKGIVEINEEAVRFYNDGKMPVFPPVTYA
jgi:GT2 family glycosyltransferase